MNTIANFFIYLSLFSYISWQSFVFNFSQIDGAGRIPSFLVSFSLCLMLGKKNVIFPKSLYLFGIWWFYLLVGFSCVSWPDQSFPQKFDFAFLMFFEYWFCVLLALQWKMEPKKTAFVLISALLFSLFLNIANGHQDLFSNKFERLFTVVNINEIALFACALQLVIMYIYSQSSERERMLLRVIYVISIIMLWELASRTAIIVAVFLTVAYCFINIDRRSFFWRYRGVTWILLFVFALIIYHLYFDAMVAYFENSSLVQRFMNQESEVEQMSLENTFLNRLFGERAVYWVRGWDLFCRFPVLGCGYKNFATYYETPCHNEWIGQLCEGGIVGFFLMAIAFWNIFIKFLTAPFPRRKRMLLLVCFTALIIMGLGLFLSHLIPFWVIIGLLCAETEKKQFPSNASEKVELCQKTETISK